MNITSWLVTLVVAVLFLLALRYACKTLFGNRGCGCHGGDSGCSCCQGGCSCCASGKGHCSGGNLKK